MEHLHAIGDDDRAAVVSVVLLLTGDAAVERVPPVATHALAGANLLLLTKPGGPAADGLPKLRPIGMPEVIRKLVASELAGTVRDAAAELLAPLQLGAGVSSACERAIHELNAYLALHHDEAVLQLEFANEFNLVSRPAVRAMFERAFPLLAPYFRWVYEGDAPHVYGWAIPAGENAAGGLMARLCLPSARGTLQEDPLGPLMHALAIHLVLTSLATAQPQSLVKSVHDDVFMAAPPEALAAVMRDAGAWGAAVDAELAPTKSAAWCPIPQPTPAGFVAK